MLSPLLLLCTVLAAAETEADWPQFRGPKRDNVSPDKGLLQEWPKDGPPLAWQMKGLGSGYSSVTLSGKQIFTLGNKESNAQGNKKNVSFVHALDRATGQLQWSTELGDAGNDLGCTPTVDGDRVYAIGQKGDLVCLTTAKGEVLWRANFVKDFDGKFGGWRYTESPTVDGDRLVCTPGGKDAGMVAFDKKTGKVIWKCAIPTYTSEAGYSSIVIAEVGGIRQYVQLMAAGLVGVEAKEGKFLWKYEKLGHNTANIPTPIVLGDKILAAAGYGKGGALLQLVPENGGITAKEIYFSSDLTNKHGGIVVVGDYVYGDRDDSGSPFCIEVKTGKVVWRKKERSDGTGSAAVTYADGRLYYHYQNGVTALVKTDATEYKEVGSFKPPKLSGTSWAHPVVVAGKLYLREGDMLYCYDVKRK